MTIKEAKEEIGHLETKCDDFLQTMEKFSQDYLTVLTKELKEIWKNICKSTVKKFIDKDELEVIATLKKAFKPLMEKLPDILQEKVHTNAFFPHIEGSAHIHTTNYNKKDREFISILEYLAIDLIVPILIDQNVLHKHPVISRKEEVNLERRFGRKYKKLDPRYGIKVTELDKIGTNVLMKYKETRDEYYAARRRIADIRREIKDMELSEEWERS